VNHDFRVTSSQVDGTVVVSVVGEADLATVPDFADELWKVVDRREPRIVVDFCKARFIDSRMVELLLSAAARALRSDTRIAISCDADNILQVLNLCGVDRKVPVRPGLPAAIEAIH
jgi:anti-anti-sigma factor